MAELQQSPQPQLQRALRDMILGVNRSSFTNSFEQADKLQGDKLNEAVEHLVRWQQRYIPQPPEPGLFVLYQTWRDNQRARRRAAQSYNDIVESLDTETRQALRRANHMLGLAELAQATRKYPGYRAQRTMVNKLSQGDITGLRRGLEEVFSNLMAISRQVLEVRLAASADLLVSIDANTLEPLFRATRIALDRLFKTVQTDAEFSQALFILAENIGRMELLTQGAEVGLVDQRRAVLVAEAEYKRSRNTLNEELVRLAGHLDAGLAARAQQDH